jgi:uncharacterized protein
MKDELQQGLIVLGNGADMRIHSHDVGNGKLLSNRLLILGSTLVALALAIWPSIAAAGEVKDRAGYFSLAAVAKANEGLQAIQRLYNRDMVVSTYETLPPQKAEIAKKMDAQAREGFFATWVIEMMRLDKVKDVFVVVCKDPAHVQIALGPDMMQIVLSPEDQGKFRDLIVHAFQAKKYDQGLLDGVQFIRAKLDDGVFRYVPGPSAKEVKDFAALFSPQAIEKAGAQIQQIASVLKRPVAVDVFKQPPDTLAKQLEKAGGSEKERLWVQWSRDRIQAGRFKGIYILITKQPGHVEVGVTPDVSSHAFRPSDREKLQKLLIQKFGAREFDDGLLAGLSLIEERVRANLGTGAASAHPAAAKTVTSASKTGPTQLDETKPAPPPASSNSKSAADGGAIQKISEGVGRAKDAVAKEVKREVDAGPSWMWVVWVVVALLVMWIVIGVLRALFRSRPQPQNYYQQAPMPPSPPGGYRQAQPPAPVAPPARPAYGAPPMQPMAPGGGYYPPPPPASGGGGFMSGLLGGMFGAAAGNWIYDAFSGRPRHSGGSWDASPAYGGEPYHSAASSPSPDSGGNIGAGGYYGGSANVDAGGGDFGDSAQGNIDAGGGDFGESANVDAGGGDFGEAADADGGGGDFGDTQDQSGGGDFDSGGGDFGDSGGDSGGGDF